MEKGLVLTLIDIGLPFVTAIVVMLVGIYVGRIDARNKAAQEENIAEHRSLEARIEELARDQRKCQADHAARAVRSSDIAEIRGNISAIFARLNVMATMSSIEDLRTRMNNLETALIDLARGNGRGTHD